MDDDSQKIFITKNKIFSLNVVELIIGMTGKAMICEKTRKIMEKIKTPRKRKYQKAVALSQKEKSSRKKKN